MAKIDNDSPFGDNNKMKKAKMDTARENLKPVDGWLTFDEYLMICVKEGMLMLEAEEKEKAALVKPPEPQKTLDDKLGETSTNPYIKARSQILQKMTAKARSVIDQMENGSLDKDRRYDKFVEAVAALGDKLSSQ